jgi:hypothetical protein
METQKEAVGLRNSNDQGLGEQRDYQYDSHIASEQQEYLSDEDPSSESLEQELQEDLIELSQCQEYLPNGSGHLLPGPDIRFYKD